MINAYPLTWPRDFPRTKIRSKSAFKTSLAGALKNVENSLRAFSSDSAKKIERLVISSNVTLGAKNPEDSGVAVWFFWDGLEVCFPVDRYLRVEENLQAIHHIIEARRTELRHGGIAIVRATFTGFKALPAPKGTDWRTLFDVPLGSGNVTDQLARARIHYRSLANLHHPDKGGDAQKMAEINSAWDEAQKELA